VTKIRQLCLVSVLLTSGVASAANVRLQVEGLSGALEKNVRAQLSTIQSDEVTPDRRFRARVDDAIREGLKALGYYEPTIDFDLRPPPKKGRQVLIARVSAGEPVRIGGTNVVRAAGRVPTGITWICSARGRRSAPCLTMAITTISKKS
jgi:translocation and assembly module TamA